MNFKALAVAALLFGALTACGNDDTDTTDTPTSAPTSPYKTQATPNTPAASLNVPTPNAATADAYIADLNAIDSDIVHNNREAALDRGRNMCVSIRDFPGQRDKLVALTNERFTSPDHPQGFGTVTAAKILAVVHNRLCPGLPAPSASASRTGG